MEDRATYNARKAREQRVRRSLMTEEQKYAHRESGRGWRRRNPEAWADIQRRRYKKRSATWEGYFQKKVATIRKINGPRRGLEVSPLLNADYLVALHAAQAGRCVLTGRELLRDGGPDTCSVDRVNNARGYVPGNVRLITWQANSALGAGTDRDLRQFCRDVLARD